jgi:hypothetical protein
MAKNFIDEDERSPRLSYAEGFRFGFGFFIANLLGLTVLAGVGLLAHYVATQLH